MVSEEYAWLYFDMERYEEALKWVLEAIEKRDTFRRQYLKGGILRGLKRYEEEAAVYRGLMDQGEDGYYICYRMAGPWSASTDLRRRRPGSGKRSKGREASVRRGTAWEMSFRSRANGRKR